MKNKPQTMDNTFGKRQAFFSILDETQDDDFLMGKTPKDLDEFEDAWEDDG